MKTLKNKKALSPVVASIILIAVTVAVSIAVAAWMGALSFSFMGSGEQLNVGSPYGWTANTVLVDVTCPGGNTVTITSVRVNGLAATFAANPTVVAPTETKTLTITNGVDFSPGVSYQIVVVTQKNHEYQTTGMAP